MSETYYKSAVLLKSPLYFLLVLIAMFCLCGCTHSEMKNQIAHGIITYDISYQNNSGKSFPIQLLPKTLEMKFNHNYISYLIEDRVGLFSICNITDLKKRSHKTLIKVFDKKFVFQGNSKESPIFFKSDISFDVKFMPDTCRLAGIPCNTASITDMSTNQTFTVLYSTKSGLNNPNYNTPYGEINGLLLQFSLKLKNLSMKLTAKKIDSKKIDDNEFMIPEDYKYITRTQMEEIIDTLLP